MASCCRLFDLCQFLRLRKCEERSRVYVVGSICPGHLGWHALRLKGRFPGSIASSSTTPYGASLHIDQEVEQVCSAAVGVTFPQPITWATPTCSSSTLRECGMGTRSLPRRHGRRRNRSLQQVPLTLRHRLLHVRFDGQYVFQVSPVDSGGRMSSIARSPFPRMSLRGFCFRACVLVSFNYASSRGVCSMALRGDSPRRCWCRVERADQGVQVRQRYWLQL